MIKGRNENPEMQDMLRKELYQMRILALPLKLKPGKTLFGRRATSWILRNAGVADDRRCLVTLDDVGLVVLKTSVSLVGNVVVSLFFFPLG